MARARKHSARQISLVRDAPRRDDSPALRNENPAEPPSEDPAAPPSEDPAAPPSEDPAAPHYGRGDVIATKYQLTNVIGEGGMGAIWQARNEVLHVDVAIKLINRKVASAEASQRLLVEARSAAQLDHPSIVRVHDFGTTEFGDPFIVMELLEGETLGQVLDRQGRLSPEAAVQLVLPVLGALSAAHAKGIVHRDIKPDNIILTTNEAGAVIPKLVDFGIAKVAGAPVHDFDKRANQAETAGRIARRLTQSGSLLGSPDYMAPEQARGDDVDERTDLWSISVVLYEAMVGDVPFSDPSLEKLLMRILLADPAPITAFGVGDATLWEALNQGLKKPKTQRWQTARQMGKALAMWLLARAIDNDITGTSLRQQWLGERVRKFSFGLGAMRNAPDGLMLGPDGAKAKPVAAKSIPMPELLGAARAAQQPADPLGASSEEILMQPAAPSGRAVTVAVIGAVVVLAVVAVGATYLLAKDDAVGDPPAPVATDAPQAPRDESPALEAPRADGDESAPDDDEAATAESSPARPAALPTHRPRPSTAAAADEP
ncbi:MAG: protein kinase, partial [Deltaproteobacteria bacterium]|nr:protein kinase [Deltaproteobacteria bacterium]MBW2532586.1 protein kinase [Deltaproteobacteria bacterium]